MKFKSNVYKLKDAYRKLSVPQFTIVTGLADLIAVNLNFALSGMPLYFALVLIFVSTVILTQFISNADSVALILPVAIEFSNVLSISPGALIMLVLFGASQSFLTPMGYQTNLMVYGLSLIHI